MVSFRGQKKLGPLPDRSPTYVIHMSSTFAPSLTAGIIFRRVGFHDRYRKRVLHLLMEEKKKTGQGSGLFSQKKCKEGIAFRPQSD